MGNDVTILASILGILVLMGLLVPLAAEMVGVNVDEGKGIGDTNTTGALEDIGWGTLFSSGSVIVSLIKALFWSYDWFPAWLIILHILVRIIAIFIVVRLARGTG